MVESIIKKTVNVPLYDLTRLSEYENKSKIVRKALDLFIEKEKRIDKDVISKDITDTFICFGIEKEALEYLTSICSNKKPNSQRYFTFSELLRIALRDFWEIIDTPIQEECIESEVEPKGNYLERNGIKIIRIA